MLVLTIPWILLLLLVITVVFLFKKKWKKALLLLLLILAINWWSDCFCFGFRNTFSGDLKVLSFNVDGESQLVMGDLNDVCGLPALKKFATAGLKDAWSEGGFGYGATIHTPLPYRIDHILHNEGLVLKGVKVIDTSDISDHNALVAVFDFSN